VFAAGKFKGMGTPGVPLSEEQRALLQADVEEIAADFKEAVLARGRRIPDEAMEGQSFSARKAQRYNLAGVVRGGDEVMARLRSVAAPQVDKPSRASTPMKTVEDQLNDALARIQTLESDAKAREALMADASSQIEARRAELQQACTERDTLKGQLIAAQGDVQRLNQRNGELETQVRDLSAREQDLDKRAAAKAAQIAAEMGTQVPARVTPGGDSKPTTAADVWNRQFTKA